MHFAHTGFSWSWSFDRSKKSFRK